MALEAILWDFDGLIIDTETGAYETTREIFAEHGVPLDVTWWHGIIGSTDRMHWFDLLQSRVEHPLDREEILARRNERKLAALHRELIRPGVVALLDEAAAAGLSLAVASSSSRPWVVPNLERIGLLDRFTAVITSTDLDGDVGRTKPAPDLYLLAADALSVAPSACVAIEDSPNGVAAAKAAGVACLAVPAGMTADLDCSRADRCVPTLEGVTVADVAELLDTVVVDD